MDALTIKAVIFDLDGTIVSFNLDYKALRSEIVKIFMERGYQSSIFSPNESIFRMLEKASRCMRNNGEEEKEIIRMKEKVFSRINRYELQAARTTHLLPSVFETLRAIKEMKFKAGLFTISGKIATGHILKSFHLKNFFDTIVTRESALAVKPDPAHLWQVLRSLRVKPEEAVVVGDSVTDMRCARSLDVIAVGVTTGISASAELTQNGADYVISSLSNLIPLIGQINK